eukprot:8922221-Pyramimonas_sp.AAC.1
MGPGPRSTAHAHKQTTRFRPSSRPRAAAIGGAPRWAARCHLRAIAPPFLEGLLANSGCHARGSVSFATG